jgi:hypothetical protein
VLPQTRARHAHATTHARNPIRTHHCTLYCSLPSSHTVTLYGAGCASSLMRRDPYVVLASPQQYSTRSAQSVTVLMSYASVMTGSMPTALAKSTSSNGPAPTHTRTHALSPLHRAGGHQAQPPGGRTPSQHPHIGVNRAGAHPRARKLRWLYTRISVQLQRGHTRVVWEWRGKCLKGTWAAAAAEGLVTGAGKRYENSSARKSNPGAGSKAAAVGPAGAVVAGPVPPAVAAQAGAAGGVGGPPGGAVAAGVAAGGALDMGALLAAVLAAVAVCG